MSSYVVDKANYMKAAGAVYALVNGTFDKSLYIPWYRERYEGKRLEEALKKAFTECFEMNALSVQEQYHDAEPWTDFNEYSDEFDEGRQLTYYIHSTEDKMTAVTILQNFFYRVLYQVESVAYEAKMKAFFWQILDDVSGYAWDVAQEGLHGFTLDA